MMTGKQRLWKSLKLRNGKIVSSHDGSGWKIGEWREVPPPKEECAGLNCCKSIYDAFCYVNPEVLAEVEVDGVVINGSDKITAQRMRIIRAWKWKDVDTVSTIAYVFKKSLKFCKNDPDLSSAIRKIIEKSNQWIENPNRENLDAWGHALFGGYWTNATMAGAFYWYLNLPASLVDRALGARLAFFGFDYKMETHNGIIRHLREMEEILPDSEGAKLQ